MFPLSLQSALLLPPISPCLPLSAGLKLWLTEICVHTEAKKCKKSHGVPEATTLRWQHSHIFLWMHLVLPGVASGLWIRGCPSFMGHFCGDRGFVQRPDWSPSRRASLLWHRSVAITESVIWPIPVPRDSGFLTKLSSSARKETLRHYAVYYC